MNIILNPGQTNTKQGDISLIASVNLTGQENRLWKIVNVGGVPQFALPTGITDQAFYVGASGDIAGNTVAAEAPALGDQCRIILDGACNPGDQLTLSTTALGTYGNVIKPAAGYGTGYYMFIAEQAGVAGQRVLCRRIPDRVFTL
jgi:phage-related tail fiber protein